MSTVTSPGGTEEKSALGRCVLAAVRQRKLTFRLASLAVTCLSCTGIVPTDAKFFLGSIPEPKGHLVEGEGRATLQARERRRENAHLWLLGNTELKSSSPGAADSDSEVRGALQIGCSRDHSPRAPVPAQPPLHPAPRSCGLWGIAADTSERADSVLED